MPNYCENCLTLQGSADLIRQFISENTRDTEEGPTLDFSKSVPVEETANIEDTDALWGTKWNAIYVDAFNASSNSIAFDTAWSPPLRWFRVVASRYPQIKFSLQYEEPNERFQGSFEINVAQGISVADEWEYDPEEESSEEQEESSDGENNQKTICA